MSELKSLGRTGAERRTPRDDFNHRCRASAYIRNAGKCSIYVSLRFPSVINRLRIRPTQTVRLRDKIALRSRAIDGAGSCKPLVILQTTSRTHKAALSTTVLEGASKQPDRGPGGTVLVER